ncbi:MAG: hypothetical protein H0T60_18360 [Acidobacteria bacterium]|nr:hypothetical protein [Acidobacteriota bacterium]
MEVSDAPELDSQDRGESEDREDERGGDDDLVTDAPTAVEENEAMSTILSGDTLDGVQRDASDV